MKKVDSNPILNLIPTNKKITREEIVGLTGFGDRTVRELINKAKKDTVILFNSNEPGYRRAKKINECSEIELQQELKEIDHCINYLRAIKDDYNYQLRTYIAYKKVAEKKLTEATVNK